MTKRLREAPDKDLLARLRVLEKKMGLVLTLVCEPSSSSLRIYIPTKKSQFKASVWGVINEQPATETTA
jgi:DASH complex subunit DAD3